MLTTRSMLKILEATIPSRKRIMICLRKVDRPMMIRNHRSRSVAIKEPICIDFSQNSIDLSMKERVPKMWEIAKILIKK